METAVLGFNSDGQGSNIRKDTFWEKWWIYNGDTQIVLDDQTFNFLTQNWHANVLSYKTVTLTALTCHMLYVQ